jgi:hypothetical protein
MRDLVGKARWVLTYDDQAREIEGRGTAFTGTITYNTELRRAADPIADAIRDPQESVCFLK